MNGTFAGMKIFSGNSNRALAESIAKILGMSLGNAEVTKFSDGEIAVSLFETVRGCDCYIINSTDDPVNDNLMEICIMTDAMRRASAGRITAVLALQQLIAGGHPAQLGIGRGASSVTVLQ